MFPLSLLLQGNALNITCISYAGTLNFGFTGARDSLPHLQHLAVFMGESFDQLYRLLLGGSKAKAKPKAAAKAKPKPKAKPPRRPAGASAAG